MESNNNNTATTPSAGFDLNGLLSSPGIGELIKHLLSAGGAALFNYLISIKPMQEKIEALTKENKELREKIEDVVDSQEELILKLNKKFIAKEIEEEVSSKEDDYFDVKRKDRSSPERKRKYLN
ncbi:MAG: hypothetical protein H0W84_06265 [Bacteroidetes bacterium]|nr:hypothetical protein [Bacteroidota bacterium]